MRKASNIGDLRSMIRNAIAAVNAACLLVPEAIG